MKKIFLALSLIGLVSLSSCENETGGCIEIRVLSNVCGMSAVQVVSGNFPGDLVTWTNWDNQTYENVFGTFIDPCLIDGYTGDSNETFFIEIIDERQESNCVVCLALPANMPENFYHIQQVTDCSAINEL